MNIGMWILLGLGISFLIAAFLGSFIHRQEQLAEDAEYRA